MELGLGSYAFRWNIGIKDQQPAQPMTAFDLLDQVAKRGLKVMQYADNLPLDRLSAADHDRLAAEAAGRGIALELGTQCFDADEVSRYLQIGQRLDAKILRVALDAEDAEMPVHVLAEQLRPLLDRAQDAGIRIAIENHFNYPSPRMVTLLDTLNHPALGVCLDVANSICAGEWPEETVRMLAPYAINLHLKDYVITPDPYGVGFRIHGVPLGQGRAPIRWILDQLSHCPPDMSVILEHWLPMTDGLDDARAKEEPWLDQTVAAARTFIS
ncbi:sugar phosphate isomerase/epimerase [Paracoccus sp. SCSIO 75233]|uniref:sugar phosphate isomerase/epimerase family protein n=1 Tax=Paracoccus sp. SCSIO 75233 TaxID=3017782 RepID=UPI0022F0DEFA|nr:sugar phosphate isomerase/epimerase family protein [Paracoccus sp. SCSIO 75233]WBU53090.1 sugar phosphate isomerase/epimerase [Paracoccus sp. SCSIO 75233]